MRRMQRPLAITLVFCLAIGLLFVRAPDALLAPQFWAEDANHYWLDQYERGFLTSLFRTYAGYVQVMPRLIAATASPLPYSMHPAAFVAAAALVTGWTAATIAALPLPPLLAGLLGLCIVLVAPGEALANPTNLQWIMAAALPLIAATQAPSGAIARANQIGFVALSGLSGPFSVLMMPIWLWCVASGRRGRFDLVIAGTALSVGLAELAFVLTTPQAAVGVPQGMRGVLWTLLPPALTEPFGFRGSLPAFMVVALVLGWAALSGQFRHHRRICLAFGLAVLLAAAWKFRLSTETHPAFGTGVRYLHLPETMVVFCAVTLLFERMAALILGLAGCILFGLNLSRTMVRTPFADFSREWSQNSALIGKRALELPVSPSWTVRIPPR
jgi:hypothetical protein